MPELKTIPLSEIDPPSLPIRETMDDVKLRELADDIAANGVRQPISIFINGDRYEIIFGHRRYEASRLADMPGIPALVYTERPPNLEALQIAENLYREDMNDAQVARWLCDLWQQHGYTEEQLCNLVRKSADWVADRLRLLRGCPKVLDALSKGQIAFSVARELNKCTDDSYRNYLTVQAVEAGSSARVVSNWVLDWKKQAMLNPPAQTPAADNGAGAPTTDAAVPAAAPSNQCWICGGNNFPWTIHFNPVHDHCKDQVVRAMSTPPAEG